MKSISILIILIFGILKTYSQSIDKAFELFDAGQYEQAAVEFEKALPSIEKEYGATDTINYSLILIYTAVSFERSLKYTLAEKYYLNAKAVYEQNNAVLNEWYCLVIGNLALLYDGMGNYEKAESLYLQELRINKKVLGEEHPNYAASLNNLALLYDGMGNYEKAEPLYLQKLEINKKVLGEEHPDYARSLNNLAGLYRNIGNYEKAETLYLQELEINKKVLGEEHPDYARSLNNLAIFYNDLSNYEKAEPLYLQALEISKKVLGEEHPNYVRTLNSLAIFYHQSSNYEKAEPLYLQALEISKKVLGEEHPAYATSLNNLAGLNKDMGNYEKAEPLYLQALEIRKKVLGEEHTDYAASLNNLAVLYEDMGNYEKAEPLYLQVLKISKKVLGEEHPDYATVLNNLALLYQNMGNYKKAEPLHLQASGIKKKVLGEEHPDYATSLNNLAELYKDLGNYEKAEPLYLQALEIHKKILGEEHPNYATSLNNLAVFYDYLGNYEKTEPLYLQALGINKKVLGEEHPGYASILYNLALLYQNMGNYEKAEPLYLQALGINKKVLGEEHPDYATILNSLAGLYRKMGNYEKAESLYLQALKIRKKVLGEEHPDYAITLLNLGLLYQNMDNYEKTEPIYLLAMNKYLSQIQQQFGFLSEMEKEKYLATNFFFLAIYQNFILQQQVTNPTITRYAYEIELAFKKLVLNAGKQLRILILNSRDSSAINTYNSWIGVRESLAEQYSRPLAKQTLDTKMLEAQANELEKQLTRFSLVSSNLEGLQSVHWEEVQKKLDHGEAAIEFTHFNYHNGKQWTDTIVYMAYVLKKNDVYPKMVPLFEGKQIDSLLQKGNRSDQNFFNHLYNWGNNDKNNNSGKGRRLYDLVWKPLEKHLDSIQKVYFSPSGRLHQLSFAAISCSETELLSDRYQLQQLTSTAQITLNQQEKPIKNMVLYGGIDYDTDLNKLQSIANQYKQSQEELPMQASRSISRDYIRGGAWFYLDGTMTEIEKIKKLAENKDIKFSMLTGNEAVEESIKNLQGDKSPEVMHIATHGFFFPDAEKNYDKIGLLATRERSSLAFKLSDNPLLRSGLVFAGANHAWIGEDIPHDLDDGILTAYEVSNMYLPNTELVVLSACETGLGEIKGSEGVFGLQRSFKIAGTNYILMSLWQIPDYQTSELMNHFYTEWFSGKPIQEAFNMAQDFMKSKYPGQPFLWAGFVLVR